MLVLADRSCSSRVALSPFL